MMSHMMELLAQFMVEQRAMIAAAEGAAETEKTLADAKKEIRRLRTENRKLKRRLELAKADRRRAQRLGKTLFNYRQDKPSGL